MGVLFRDQKDKKEYYKKEAADLKRRADKVMRETGDKVEASRLESLAKQSGKAADSIDQQLDNIADKI